MLRAVRYCNLQDGLKHLQCADVTDQAVHVNCVMCNAAPVAGIPKVETPESP